MLEPFQCATVDAAVARLSRRGPKRFLIADEVGLGKTVIAREVARALNQNQRPFNVLYLCPSREIAGQNQGKLVELTGMNEETYRPGEDRLSLVPYDPPKRGDNGFRIYSFTPATSLPGWKPGIRTGRKTERELIRRVVERYPRLLQRLEELDQESGTRLLLPETTIQISGYTKTLLDQALRDVFMCRGAPIASYVLEWLDRGDTGIAEFIARARAALALATLRSDKHSPNLIILDEFHRYADLILPVPPKSDSTVHRERAEVHRLLVDALLKGTKRPGILLLSATPYRLRRLNGDEMHPAAHYSALIDLAGFLTDSKDAKAEIKSAVWHYQDALHSDGDAGEITRSVKKAKQRVENLLRPVIARTERALIHVEDLFDRKDTPVKVKKRDLQNFRHFAHAAADAKANLRGWLPSWWISIPYPAQTMHGYAIWPAILAAAQPTVHLTGGRGKPAHPQLRELSERFADVQNLSLPWQPPTLHWWRLEGAWAKSKALPGKTLLFSQWRAAPTAIAAFMSMKLDGFSLSHGGGGKHSRQGLLRPGGNDCSALVSLFMPWPILSHAIEPLKEPSATIARVKRQARQDLKRFLRQKSISCDGTGKRPTWEVACGVERHIEPARFSRLVNTAARSKKGKGAPDWSTVGRIDEISPAELAALAELLLAAPGSILARCVRRHGLPSETTAEMQSLFKFSWGELRRYLGHRAFARPIIRNSNRRRYPEALCEAMLKGGFEAVLDEQCSILLDLGGVKKGKLLEELASSLLDRPGLVRVRRNQKDERIPVQAVVSFSGSEQPRSKTRDGRKLRSDGLRKAFNSPFWPHILATTSVGQEGLDFHLWCARVVHWDIPSDPVDFEQREGRIARYASLMVRRSLATDHGDEALATSGPTSPFGTLLELAQRRPATQTGLETWWLPSHARPESINFEWPFSLKTTRRKVMLQNLLYYRLGLGQPDPEAFMTLLTKIDADPTLARSLAINLAAVRLSNGDH